MRERAPQNLPVCESADLSRRSFIQYGTLASVAATLSTLTSCSSSTTPVLAPPARTTPRSNDPDNFDNLDAAATLIGVPFTLNIIREDGTKERVQAKFTDSMTIELDGDTHSVSGLIVNDRCVHPESNLGGTGYTARSLVEDVRPNAENTGICFHSSLGSAQVSKTELSKLLSALKHPEAGTETEQEIWMEFDVELTDAGRGALGIGNTVNAVVNVFCSLTGQEASAPRSIDIPKGCTLHITSVRKAADSEAIRELPPEIRKELRALLEKLFPWFSPASS